MIILITGASSGFGEAITEKFASEGWDCLITGRRKERLVQLSDKLSKKYNVSITPIDFDVRNRKSVFEKLASLPQVDVLVNNAGLALGKDNFDTASLDDWETMIDTNIKGLLYVSKAIIPSMIKRKKGHIFNMGSVAAKIVYQGGNIYCATKHAVDAISQSMRIELLPYQIKVTAIHPGAAETEFSMVRFKGDKKQAEATYEGYTPLYAKDIAREVFHCATLPENVCINDLVITATAQANGIYFFKNDQK